MTRLDRFTLSLLTNDEVIDVDQDPLGKPGRQVWKKGPLEVGATWADLRISGRQSVRDLWRQEDVGVFEGRYAAPVDRHGIVLVRLSKAP